MAHFAKLDENNIITEVIVVDNANIIDENGQESEELGIQFCKRLFGENTNWVQTSYNKNFRKRFAGIGGRYIQEKDIFATRSPFPSWTTYNIETDEWEPPVPRPPDGENYEWYWSEKDENWIQHYKEI